MEGKLSQHHANICEGCYGSCFFLGNCCKSVVNVECDSICKGVTRLYCCVNHLPMFAAPPPPPPPPPPPFIGRMCCRMSGEWSICDEVSHIKDLNPCGCNCGLSGKKVLGLNPDHSDLYDGLRTGLTDLPIYVESDPKDQL